MNNKIEKSVFMDSLQKSKATKLSVEDLKDLSNIIADQGKLTEYVKDMITQLKDESSDLGMPNALVI